VHNTTPDLSIEEPFYRSAAKFAAIATLLNEKSMILRRLCVLSHSTLRERMENGEN
jgi:hypothetical protein